MRLVYVAIGLIIGMIAGGAIASHIYVPQLRSSTPTICEVSCKKQVLYPIGTFEHEVKRTE
jgi:hypothetical protein